MGLLSRMWYVVSVGDRYKPVRFVSEVLGSYQPEQMSEGVKMPHYEIFNEKPKSVQAHRWWPAKNWRDSLKPDSHGVTMITDDRATLAESGRDIPIKPGEWIVYGAGGCSVMSNEHFKRDYDV